MKDESATGFVRMLPILAGCAVAACNVTIPTHAEKRVLMEGGNGSARPSEDFSQSYGVWVSVDEGRCVYWLTDVGLNATQLTEALVDGYEAQRGLEILTSHDTPDQCVSAARSAAIKAGFQLIRARRGTDKDRLQGIP